MKHETVTIKGSELEARWSNDNVTPAEIAGIDSINRNAMYDVSWPDHVLTPKFNVDCDIREVTADKVAKNKLSTSS